MDSLNSYRRGFCLSEGLSPRPSVSAYFSNTDIMLIYYFCQRHGVDPIFGSSL